jgi:predicted esterase
MVPYTESPLRPFLESVAVADYEGMAPTEQALDRHGLAFLRMNARGNTNGQRLGVVEILAAIEQVKSDYAIDPDRIYLYGICSGGRESLALAETYPHLFAAIATLSPATRYSDTTIGEQHRETDDYACDWLDRRSPLHRLNNLRGIPLLVFHGEDDEHNPLPVSMELRDLAQREGLSLDFRVVPGATHVRFPHDINDTAFSFLASKRCASVEEQVAPPAPMSISDAFTAPFLVVVASDARKAGDAFLKSWKQRFFTDCPWKLDVDVTEEDVRTRNLILIGTPSGSALLDRVVQQLPLTRTAGAYSLQAVFANPMNPARRVVVAGDPDCVACPSDALQLVLKGWYQYALWSYDDKSAKLAEIGWLDSAGNKKAAARCSSKPIAQQDLPTVSVQP